MARFEQHAGGVPTNRQRRMDMPPEKPTPGKASLTPTISQRTIANQFVCEPAGPAQIVLVLQGGGALGAYQGGVYEALHEAGIEPNWIVGTSIGAVNAALIAGNEAQDRLPKLQEFWRRVQRKPTLSLPFLWPELHEPISSWTTLINGVPGLCRPNPLALLGAHLPLGTEQAGFYSTSPLEATLSESR